jgi:hypothetical protein
MWVSIIGVAPVAAVAELQRGTSKMTFQSLRNDGPTDLRLVAHHDPALAEIEAALRDLWQKVRAAALEGDVETVLSFIAAERQEYYRETFARLGRAGLSASFGSIEMIHVVSATEYTAEVEAIRTEDGTKYSYPMEFVEERDGVWKVARF